MISQITINGFPLYHPTLSIITNVTGLASPSIDLATYNRGGRDGLILGLPFYRQLAFTIEVFVTTHDSVSLLEQKTRFIGQLRLDEDRRKLKTVVFEMDNGETRSCHAIVKNIQSDATPEMAHSWTKIVFQMVAQRWYLAGGEKVSEVLSPYFGGMAVPMIVPMDIAVGATEIDKSQITNSGNTESPPNMQIVGPISGATISNMTTGKSINIVTELGDNDLLELDFYNHLAIRNRVENVRGDISGEWFYLTPGANNLLFSASERTSDTKCIVSYTDAYLGI